MARQTNRVGVNCSECGVHRNGEKTNDGRTRCGKCGQFGEEAEQYCVEHDTNYAGLPGSGCPYCREEERIRAQEREMHARRSDPQMHPSVDARRY
jgi:hypothetical protein